MEEHTPFAYHSLYVGDCYGDMWVCRDGHSWMTVKQPPVKREFYAACATKDNTLVVTGGDWSTACYKYSPRNDVWAELPSLQEGRSYHGCVWHGGAIYVVGGFNGNNHLSSVEMLSMEGSRAQWSRLPSLPRPHYHPLVVSANNQLWVVGGYQLTNVCMLESTQGAWQEKAPMPYEHSGGAVASFDDQILIVDGTAERRCMLYSISTNQWLQCVQRPQFKHSRGVAAPLPKTLIVCGGEDSDSTIEEYDPRTDQWSQWNLKMPVNNFMGFASFL